MKFSEMVDQVVEFLRRRERVSYRALKREFDLDDESLEDLKVADANGFCGHSRKPPIEEAIKKLCNQFG